MGSDRNSWTEVMIFFPALFRHVIYIPLSYLRLLLDYILSPERYG